MGDRSTLAKRASSKKNGKSDSAALGIEAQLWAAADKMRGHMDPGEYKHVALGLIFLKYIADAFDTRRAAILKETDGDEAAAEDRDEYAAESVFWVPKEARWASLQAQARSPEIGQLIDAAMIAIEKENPSLKGVLPKSYGRPDLDKTRLGELIDLIGKLGLGGSDGMFDRSKDLLGRVYEYFLGRFASAEGKGGGEFYTPACVVRLLVEMLEPYRGRVYDPCCGSGGMFVQSEKFVLAHGGKLSDLSVYGQESNPTTWRLAKMNLALRHIDANLGPQHGDSFSNDLHKDLKADFVLANPPFNISDWGGERLRDDARWKHGTPPAGNANFAWVQHILHHLAPHGVAGFVLANGSMSSNTGGEGEIRKALVEADLVDCMIALPGQLFFTTQIPVCLWFLARDKKARKVSVAGDPVGRFHRDRRGQTLFIDARKLGTLVDRIHRELTEDDIQRIAGTYRAWKDDDAAWRDAATKARLTLPAEPGSGYQDIPGFCRSATKDEIATHGHVLTPGRYVGAAEAEAEGEPFEEKMKRLTTELREQTEQSVKLDKQIWISLRGLGYES